MPYYKCEWLQKMLTTLPCLHAKVEEIIMVLALLSLLLYDHMIVALLHAKEPINYHTQK